MSCCFRGGKNLYRAACNFDFCSGTVPHAIYTICAREDGKKYAYQPSRWGVVSEPFTAMQIVLGKVTDAVLLVGEMAFIC